MAEVPGSKVEEDDIDPLDEILEPGEEVPDFSEVGVLPSRFGVEFPYPIAYQYQLLSFGSLHSWLSSITYH